MSNDIQKVTLRTQALGLSKDASPIGADLSPVFLEEGRNGSPFNVFGTTLNPLAYPDSIKTLNPALEPNTARELCKLESEDEKAARLVKVEEAKIIAASLRLEVIRLEALVSKYKQRKYTGLGKLKEQRIQELESSRSSEAATREVAELEEIIDIKKRNLKFIPSETKHVFGHAFYNTLDYFARRTEIIRKFNDRDLTALVSYYYYKDNLSTLPKGIKSFLPDSDVILARHCFFDLNGADTARGLETVEINKVVKESGLCPVLDGLSPPEVIDLISPDCMEGTNPLVRKWLISDTNKWTGEEGKELAKKSMAWVLEHGESVFNRETGSIDLQKIRDNDWVIAVTKRHGLKGMLACSPHVKNILDCVRLGLEELGGKELVDKLPRYYITRGFMWSERASNGKRLIDDVTDDLISLMRTSHPEMFASVKEVEDKKVGEGDLIPKKVREFASWSDSYNLLATDCLRGSEMTVFEALKRRCPNVCGWNFDQVKEWEMRSRDMWEGKSGKALFRKAVAYNMGVSGLGKFKIENGELSLSFTKNDVDEWHARVVVGEYGNNLRKFVYAKKLSGGLKYSVCRDKISRLVKVLFNVPSNEKLPKITRGDGNPVNRSILTRETMKLLLDRTEGVYTIEFGEVKNQRIEESEIKERYTKLLDILSKPVQSPFDRDSVTFIRENDVQIEKGLVAEGSSLGYRFDSFDITDTRLACIFREEESPKSQLLTKIRGRLLHGDMSQIIVSLKQDEFRELLKVVRDHMVDDINVRSEIKPEMKKLITLMLSMRKGLISVDLDSKSLYGDACHLLQYNPTINSRNLKYIEVLNKTFRFLGDVLLRSK